MIEVTKLMNIQTCTRCVMNNAADPYITFDEEGVCNYCKDATAANEKLYFPGKDGEKRLLTLLEEVKNEGKDRDFDCLMGLSGGLDSSYLAYLGAEKWGLRIIAIHIDDGYDTEISTSNIRKLIGKTGIELITVSPDPEQFNALSLAYMKAGVPNLAVPQDNILFAEIFKFAKKNKIRNFLAGGNQALESILQRGNSWDAYDLVNLRDIQRRFGQNSISKLSFISHYRRKWDEKIHRYRKLRPLNFIDYRRDVAYQELSDYCGFEYYGGKHLENYFTAFLQRCWLPEKFNVDKRTSHLSSMIVSNQMTRDEALHELNEPLYRDEYMEKVKNIICCNTGISRDELEQLIHCPGHQHTAYRVDPIIKMIHRR